MTPGCGAWIISIANCRSSSKETTLYSFKGFPDGYAPSTNLVQDAAGNLYGTTTKGGSSDLGTVFKVDPVGDETILHNFAGFELSYPYADLIQDKQGNLYGTASRGGNGEGGIFKIDSAGNETILFDFSSGGTGSVPEGGLVRDPAGNLYGTTYLGGSPTCNPGPDEIYLGCGTVFKLDTTGHESVLYSFNAGTDGCFPSTDLVRDRAGNLYGTTSLCGGAYNFGVVFKVTPTGKETTLYTFSGHADGGRSQAGLVRDVAGNLYGTTSYGGDETLGGVAFELSP